jgi:CspA family cold shock protein
LAHVQTFLQISTNRNERFCAPFLNTPGKDNDMPTGTVKWYNDQKGYGFIQPDNGGKDVFVHATALEQAGIRGLAEGQKVSYDVEADRRSGKESAANLKTA